VVKRGLISKSLLTASFIFTLLLSVVAFLGESGAVKSKAIAWLKRRQCYLGLLKKCQPQKGSFLKISFEKPLILKKRF